MRKAQRCAATGTRARKDTCSCFWFFWGGVVGDNVRRIGIFPHEGNLISGFHFQRISFSNAWSQNPDDHCKGWGREIMSKKCAAKDKSVAKAMTPIPLQKYCK